MAAAQVGLKSGSKHPNWKGGITKETIAHKCSWRYKNWTLEVRARAGNECVVCGAGEPLVSHHIHPWKNYPELQYEPENGIAMCRHCHGLFHWTKDLSYSGGTEEMACGAN